MADRADVLRIAHSLEGTTSAPHFDRLAFKVERIYATLAADGRSINLKLMPDEQEFKCMLAPEAFSAVPQGWGHQGWTIGLLDKLSEEELRSALALAWEHGREKKRPSRRQR